MKLFGSKKDETSTKDAEMAQLQQAIDQSGMPINVQTVALHELEKLGKMAQGTAEHTITLNYLEYLTSLPWSRCTEDNLDLTRAESILNDAHYGLEDIKGRIIEYLATRTLKAQRRFRVLVADDEMIVRDNLQHILENEGFSVITTPNGMDAVRLIESSEFDLVFADLKIHGLDGIAILEKTKAAWPETEVIMVTGYATIDSAVEAMKKGAFHYLAKPFKLDDVRETAKQAMQKRILRQESKGPIICFMGAPGTGKTSLGKSVARALGRQFIRLSLAGMKDEAEIRGHRRTYAGSMPGRIIHEIRRAGYNNPVFMLDEVDKIGQDFRGDPASALLEVLDPEQNASFTDYYLDIPFDLSKVIFITTANIIDNIPSALLDRLEILKLSGYTEEEKKNIAAKFIIPKQTRESGLAQYSPVFHEAAIYRIIRNYTREAGVRNLERAMASICRKVARDIISKPEQDRTPPEITPDAVELYLGPRKFHFEVTEARDRVGVTTGLVWTASGGDIIFVEATKMKGSKTLIMTGSLGEIMQESAQAALSYIRANAGAFGVAEDFFEYQDVHIHVPAAAMQKDGPSAGMTIALALLSVLTGRPARRDVAMSGELTLSGRILPVGAIKEKILAAKRAGVKVVIMPERNRVDVAMVPAGVKEGIETVFVENIKEIIDIVLK